MKKIGQEGARPKSVIKVSLSFFCSFSHSIEKYFYFCNSLFLLIWINHLCSFWLAYWVLRDWCKEGSFHTLSEGDPGFSRGGHQLPKWDYFFNVCRKLHENERIWTPGGACPWRPLGSANGYEVWPFAFIRTDVILYSSTWTLLIFIPLSG